MKLIDVSSPDGLDWHVRVAWMPRWRALARRFGGWRVRRAPGDKRPNGTNGGSGGFPDFGGLDGDDILAVLVTIVGLIVFGLLFWWVLLPLILLVVDVVVVIALLVAATAARVLFGRPWTVEAVAEGHRYTQQVAGWRRALRTRDQIAERLRLGLPLDASAIADSVVERR